MYSNASGDYLPEGGLKESESSKWVESFESGGAKQAAKAPATVRAATLTGLPAEVVDLWEDEDEE